MGATFKNIGLRDANNSIHDGGIHLSFTRLLLRQLKLLSRQDAGAADGVAVRGTMVTTFFARTDSNSANNPGLNLTNDPLVRITFVPTTDGNLILEQPDPKAPDPDTLVEIGGQTYQFIYELTATLPTNSSQVPISLQGEQFVLITVLDYPDDGDSVRLVFLPSSDATDVQMSGLGTGAIRPDDLTNNPPDTPVCFASGTFIETPTGPMMVDDLRQGDLVMTVDDGPQPLVWVTSSTHAWPGSDEKYKPYQIKAGALGDGLPQCDLMVSPQHHILLRGAQCLALFGLSEVIAPAKGLTGLAGVRHMKGKKTVTYHHLLLARHALLLAGGVASESFYPGPNAIKMLSDAQRDALFALFPALRENPETGYGPTVRRKVTRQQAKQIVSMMQGNVASRKLVA